VNKDHDITMFVIGLAALDSLPEQRLVTGAYSTADGDVCLVGAIAKFVGVWPAVTCLQIANAVAYDYDLDIDAVVATLFEYIGINDYTDVSGPENRFKVVKAALERKENAA
jgi:hypothetical protein